MRITSILVPTDFSEAARVACQYASDLAAQFKCRLHVLHVVADPFRYDPWGTESVALRVAEVLRQSEQAARKELSKLIPRKGALAGRVTIATTTGTPVDQILDYAAKKRIDLVVMGTHGRGTIGHLVLGSVAERVVRRSPVPVLTLHAPKQRRPTRSAATARRGLKNRRVVFAPPVI